jgi:hypothetical protein
MEKLTKICPRCASRFAERAVTCAYCSSQLTPNSVIKRNPKIIKFKGLLVLFLLGGAAVAAVVMSYGSSADQSAGSVKQEETKMSSPASVGVQPRSEVENEVTPAPVSDIKPAALPSGPATSSVTPWQLLKNPFLQQGKLVRLDYLRFPVLANGNIFNYGQCPALPQICLQMNAFGLRFNRMLEPTEGLYDVMGEDTDISVNMTKLGEIIVEFGDSKDHPLNEDWVVMPEQPTRGTNAYGADITVPTVQYVRLASEDDAPRD